MLHKSALVARLLRNRLRNQLHYVLHDTIVQKAQQPAPQASARGALLCMTVLAPAHGANVHASAHVLFVANGSVIPLVV
jgi:hypothetical protein